MMNSKGAHARRPSELRARPSLWVVHPRSEDSALVLRTLDASYDVTSFEQSDTMLERLGRERPSAFILDGNATGKPVLEICSFLRKSVRTSSLPIAILTAAARHAELQEIFRAGADDYVTKPVSGDDLSARVASVIERRRLQNELQKRLEMQERFVAILGHDLRQPLTALGFATRRLAGELAPTERVTTVRILSRTCERMQRMVNDILDLSRTRLGAGLSIERHPVDLTALCEALIEEIRLTHPARAITLHATYECVGEWDAGRLTQMCANLILNAVEHGHPLGSVDVIVERHEREVVLRVENEGKPIPDDMRPVLFEPFHARTGSKGMGLGLFIAQQIVSGHAGRIDVDSDEAKTCFVVTLPRIAARPSGVVPSGRRC